MAGLCARAARAQPQPPPTVESPPKSPVAATGLELHWTAPPPCPAEARIHRDIQTLTGRDLTPKPGATAAVSGVVSQDGGAWIAELSIERPGETPNVRRIEGKSCREVSDAAAVIIALALDTPRLDPSDPPAPPRPPPRAAPRPAVPAKPSKPPKPAPEPRALLRGGIGAVGGVDFTALPEPTPGFGLTGALVLLERNRFELRLTGWIPQTEEVDGDAGVDLSLFAATARYCRILFGDVARLTACVGFEGGVMVASAFGFAENDTGFGRWLAPELALALEVHPARNLGVTLELEGLVPVARDYFLIDQDRVYRSGVVDGRIFLGLMYGAP
jgi:hypothetical protein